MELMQNYNNAEKLLYEHVSFTPDWVMCPIDDCTDKFWCIEGQTVKYAETIEALKDESGNHYEDDIYTQRFYEKHVFEGDKLTMVMCDPHTVGVKWFRFFDNRKRQKGT